MASHSVEFVIIGGVAISLHSSGYLTNDIDFCFSRDRQNLKRIVAALESLQPRPRNFPAELPFIWDEQTLLGGTVFTLITSIGEIDLLAEVAGVGNYDEVHEHSSVFDLSGYKVNVLSVAGLIKAKRAAGRTKDLLVLPELEALQEVLDSKDD